MHSKSIKIKHHWIFSTPQHSSRHFKLQSHFKKFLTSWLLNHSSLRALLQVTSCCLKPNHLVTQFVNSSSSYSNPAGASSWREGWRPELQLALQLKNMCFHSLMGLNCIRPRMKTNTGRCSPHKDVIQLLLASFKIK